MLAFALAAACASPEADEVESGTDGGTTTASGDQPPQCDAYVRCAAELAPETLGPILETYGPSGTCWDDPEVAELCAGACEDALANLEEAFGEGACDPGSADSTETGNTGNDEPVVIDLGDVDCIEFGRHDLLDFVVSGDPSALTCEVETGSGAGRLPPELSVSPSCAFTGELDGQRLGGWATIVRVQQPAGPDTYIPFCATLSSLPSDSVQISPAPLMYESFSAGAPLEFGGTDAPRFEVTAPVSDCFGDTCSYTFVFNLNSGEFDETTLVFDDELLLEDGNAVGMAHGFAITGPAVSAEFEARPWVLSLDVDYCFNTTPETPPCDADSGSAFAVVMRPG